MRRWRYIQELLWENCSNNEGAQIPYTHTWLTVICTRQKYKSLINIWLKRARREAPLPSIGWPDHSSWLMLILMTAALSAVCARVSVCVHALTCSAFRSRSSYKRRTSTVEVNKNNSARAEYTKPTSSTVQTKWIQKPKTHRYIKNQQHSPRSFC